MSDRRYHPQVIRAKELAREAGPNPYDRFQDGEHHRAWWRRFMDAAFEEHFQRQAVDNIYWHHYTADRWDVPSRDDDCYFGYGRCKSGRQWFWRVLGWVRGRFNDAWLDEYGWVDTEEQALIDGTAAIKRLAAGRRVIARHAHQDASRKLKEINAAKRVKRWTAAPVNGSDSHAVEYLYNRSGYKFQITKKTKQRIYYASKPLPSHDQTETGIRDLTDYPIRFIDRQKIEADGEIWSHVNSGWWEDDARLFLTPPPLRDNPPEITPEQKTNLAHLKTAMTAAHPDKGGSHEAFIAARKAYVDARRQMRHERG